MNGSGVILVSFGVGTWGLAELWLGLGTGAGLQTAYKPPLKGFLEWVVTGSGPFWCHLEAGGLVGRELRTTSANLLQKNKMKTPLVQ